MERTWEKRDDDPGATHWVELAVTIPSDENTNQATREQIAVQNTQSRSGQMTLPQATAFHTRALGRNTKLTQDDAYNPCSSRW
jgi:hypothetical protein